MAMILSVSSTSTYHCYSAVKIGIDLFAVKLSNVPIEWLGLNTSSESRSRPPVENQEIYIYKEI